MSEQYLDITPDVHFLESIRADRGVWWVLVAEAIDNAFDAGAEEVGVTLSKPLVQIQDNGQGITRDRATAIVRLGEHRPMLSTALGRFGIGLKYNAMSAGDVLDVQSVSRDGRLALTVDWAAMLARGRWQIPLPTWTAALRHAATSTTITIKRLRWPMPTVADQEKAREQLSQLFYPGLAAGRLITLNGTPLVCLREPEMTDVIETDVRLPSGKGAHVRAGLLVDRTNPLYMVHVSYKHRVILPRSSFGTEGYGGLRRMLARVSLMGDWGLRRFKDGLSDPEADALEDAVRDALRPILEQCHSAKMSADVEEMTTLINDMLPPDLVAARPPKRKDKSGGDSPKPSKPHGLTRDGVEHPTAPARLKRPPGSRIIIEFDSPLADDYGYGRFVPGRPGKIILAKDNPDIASWLEHKDRLIGARALYMAALMLYEHAREIERPQKDFITDKPFGLRVWNLAARQKTEDAE